MHKVCLFVSLHSFPTVAELEQVTGEILVALEIQGSLKAHVSNEGGSLNQRRQDRTFFGTDEANLAFVQVYAV